MVNGVIRLFADGVRSFLGLVALVVVTAALVAAVLWRSFRPKSRKD